MIHIQLCRFCIRNSSLNVRCHKELFYDYACLGDFCWPALAAYYVVQRCIQCPPIVLILSLMLPHLLYMYVHIYVGAVVVRTPTPIDDDLLVSL